MLPHELQQTLEALREELRAAQSNLEMRTNEAVRLDRDYRIAKAKAYLKVEGQNQAVRDSEVELMIETERFTAKLSEGQKEAALERLRNLRKEIDAFISMTYLTRSEISLAGYE